MIIFSVAADWFYCPETLTGGSTGRTDPRFIVGLLIVNKMIKQDLKQRVPEGTWQPVTRVRR